MSLGWPPEFRLLVPISSTATWGRSALAPSPQSRCNLHSSPSVRSLPTPRLRAPSGAEASSHREGGQPSVSESPRNTTETRDVSAAARRALARSACAFQPRESSGAGTASAGATVPVSEAQSVETGCAKAGASGTEAAIPEAISAQANHLRTQAAAARPGRPSVVCGRCLRRCMRARDSAVGLLMRTRSSRSPPHVNPALGRRSGHACYA